MDQTAIAPEFRQTPAQISTRITSANARDMAAKAAIARRLRKNPIQAAPLAPMASGELVDPALAARITRVTQRIEALIDEMEGAETAKDMQALAMALRALNEVWSLLTGHPRPGVRRDAKRRGPSSFASPVD